MRTQGDIFGSDTDCLTERLVSCPDVLEQVERRKKELRPLYKEREALLEKPEPRSAEDERRIDELRDKIREASVVDLGSFGSNFKRQNDRTPQAAQSVSPFLGANGFLDYEQVSGDNFATGSTRIPNTWSTGFIHGADSLLPVTRLASRILRPDEVIRGLERVTWKKPMTSNLQIAVMRGPMGQDPSSVMSGSLQTTQGQLTFEARLIDEPLRGIKQESNPCATLCSCPKCLTVSRGGFHQFALSAPSVPDWERELRDPALLTATMAELVTKAVNNVDLHGRGDACPFRLMGGLSDLPLPDRPEDLFTGTLKVRVNEGEMRQGRSGITIAPFIYAFPHQNVISRGFAALTGDMNVVSRVMGR